MPTSEIPAGAYVVEAIRVFVHYRETNAFLTVRSQNSSPRDERYDVPTPQTSFDSIRGTTHVRWSDCHGHDIVEGTVLNLRYVQDNSGIPILFVDWVSGPEVAS